MLNCKMIFSKKPSFLIIFLLAFMPSYSQSVLTLLFHSGETYKVSLDKKPEITFDGDGFVIKGDNRSASFPRKDIKEFYCDASSSSIKEVYQHVFEMKWESDRKICLYGEHLLTVKLFDIQGKEHDVQIVNEDNRVMLNMNGVETGTYILSINNKNNIKIYLK